MNHTMLTCVIGHNWIAKAQISLHMGSVWSKSANKIIGHYRMYEWWQKAIMIHCAFTGLSEFLHFAPTWRHVFPWCGPNVNHLILTLLQIKDGVHKIVFFISPQKHMLWVLVKVLSVVLLMSTHVFVDKK